MHPPLSRQDIVTLIPDLVLLDDGHMSWDQVGHLLNEDLRAVRHLQAMEHEGAKIPAVEDPWHLVKTEMYLFSSTEDAAYEALREELARNGEAGPNYLVPLFTTWLALKTGYAPNLIRPMTGAVLWGLTEPESEAWTLIIEMKNAGRIESVRP